MTLPPIADDFSVEPADYQRDLADLRAVREPVFLVEQNVPADLEWDDLDPRSRHVIARDLQGRPIGTGRLTPEHKIGRMAVLPQWRGRGVGAVMLQRLLEMARGLGYAEVKLHAQTHAMPFYARAGFTPEGDTFMEAGIPHQTMRLHLAPEAPLLRQKAAGEPERPVDTFEDCRATAFALLKAARHRVWVYTRDLDPDFLCTEAAMTELRRLALSGRGAALQFIVQDPGAALRPAAHLIGLAQRSSTTMALRTPVDEVDLQYAGAYLLNDVGGFLHRPLASRFEGSTSPNAPGRHRQLLAMFEPVWARSETPVELRALKL